jgi:23S rRNA (pseudouridine1915-N3)-methyltransferase
MRLALLGIGRMKAGPERELLNRYMDRAQAAARGVGISSVLGIEIDEGRARLAEQRKREEATVVQTKLSAGVRAVLLDARGRTLSSPQIADEIRKARDSGASGFCFVVGGPDGFDPEFLNAHDTLSFGAATFPHQMIRVMMAEQLYRAITILAGHPYHRD